MSAQRSILTPWWQADNTGQQLGGIGTSASSFPALAGGGLTDFSGGSAVPDPFGGGLSAFNAPDQQPANTAGQFADATQKAWAAAAKAAQNAASTGASTAGASSAGQAVGTAATQAAPALGAPTGYSTAGRTGSTYSGFLAANPTFDPWSNLDSFAGAGAGNDPIIAQAFGWTNEWARNNGFGDGRRIPLAQRQQVFLANLERARQQWSDNASNPQARQGVTWETSLARNIPNQGWNYTGPYSGGAPAAPGGGTTVSAPNIGLGLGAGAAAAAAAAQNAATQANQGGGGGGGGANAFSGRFTPAAIANAAQDPRAALDMYNLATTGGTTSGHGPFSQFYESWFGPIMSAVINASALNNGGQLPGNLDSLISQIQSGMSGGTDLFGTLGTMGRTAMQNAMGGNTGQSFDSLRNAISATNPLMTLGMSPIGRDVFYTGQQDTLRDLQGRAYTLPNMGENLTDWGQYFANSPFAKQYLGR